MRFVRPSGEAVVAEKAKWTARECRQARDRIILALTREGHSSREIGLVVNLEPESVRRVRCRLARRKREARQRAAAT